MSSMLGGAKFGALQMIDKARMSSLPVLPSCGLYRIRGFSRTMSGAVSSYLPEFVPVDDKIWAVKNISEGSIIRVVSYNILAQAYELDEFETFYKGNMDKHGYSSVYIQRSGRKRDGCGIFYKRERAELLLEEVIQYNDLVPEDEVSVESYEVEDKETSNPENCRASSPTKISGSQQTNSLDDRGDPDDPRVRLKRDCVGMLTAFKLLEPPHHVIIVANTHIYWDPEWVDVKLAQVKYLLLRLANFKDTISTKFESRPLVFVTGDFNSTPGDEVYQYLISGISQYDNGYSYKATTKEASRGSPIALHSLHASIGGEPMFTNYTPDFTGTLDYILFSSPDHVQPIRVLKLPSDESPDIQGGLPNENHPSDHLPIGADFEIH